MEFCNKKTKYEVGDEVYLNIEDIPHIPCKILGIGILGGKLSHWQFLYEVELQNEKKEKLSILEDGLSLK